jgi:hypothetical protein
MEINLCDLFVHRFEMRQPSGCAMSRWKSKLSIMDSALLFLFAALFVFLPSSSSARQLVGEWINDLVVT